MKQEDVRSCGSSLRVVVLGSAQDGGLPQMGSQHKRDVEARLCPERVRLGPSICVLDSRVGKTLLIDVSPDIKQQTDRLFSSLSSSSAAASSERRSKRNPYDAVVLTHAHMGHYAGLVHFGREAAASQELPVYATPSMCTFLERNAPWELLVRLKNIQLHPIRPIPDNEEAVEPTEYEFSPWEGLRVKLYQVPHRGEYTDTVGVSINDTLLYIPDIDSWSQWKRFHEVPSSFFFLSVCFRSCSLFFSNFSLLSLCLSLCLSLSLATIQAITAHSTCMVDATFFSETELDGRDMKEVPHPLVTSSIEQFEPFLLAEHREKRILLTHLNHTNPLCDEESAEAKHVREKGFLIAQDMMWLNL
ncbi:Pyrroloquinoline quinone biosynthesis protein PqqB [Balamuthia mandrillaris]